MRKRGLCCRPVYVCPSVRLTRWCIVSSWLKISSNFFLSSLAPSFWFSDPGVVTQFQGEPIQRGRKIQGGGKIFAIFDGNHRLLGNDDMRYVKWWHFQWLWRTLTGLSKSRNFLKSNISNIVPLTESIEWYHFQWPWLALDWNFKVHDIFRHWVSQKRHEIEP